MIDVFKSEFDSVKKQLNDYNITNIKQKINNFGTLETIIQNVFLQEDQELTGENKAIIESVKSFIDAKKKVLNDEIGKSDFVDTLERRNSADAKNVKLKALLLSLHKGINDEI